MIADLVVYAKIIYIELLVYIWFEIDRNEVFVRVSISPHRNRAPF